MVEVAEGVLLHPGVLGLPDAGAEPIGGAGRIPGVQQPGDKGQHRADRHLDAGSQNLPDVPAGDADVDDVAHQNGNDHFKAALDDHQKHPQGHVPPVGAHVAQKAFQIIHAKRSPFFACYSMARGKSQAAFFHDVFSCFFRAGMLQWKAG